MQNMYSVCGQLSLEVLAKLMALSLKLGKVVCKGIKWFGQKRADLKKGFSGY